MRWSLAVVLLCGCHNSDPPAPVVDRAAEVATLRAKVAALEGDVKQLTAANDALEQEARACMEPALVEQFRRRFEAHAGEYLFWLHAKGTEIFDEHGRMRDPRKTANAIRARSIQEYGERRAYETLINTFGAEVASAIWYQRFKARGELYPPTGSE